LFLVPLVVDPAVATLRADFAPVAAACRTERVERYSTLSNCSWSSCREGCTSELYQCVHVYVTYELAEAAWAALGRAPGECKDVRLPSAGQLFGVRAALRPAGQHVPLLREPHQHQSGGDRFPRRRGGSAAARRSGHAGRSDPARRTHRLPAADEAGGLETAESRPRTGDQTYNAESMEYGGIGGQRAGVPHVHTSTQPGARVPGRLRQTAASAAPAAAAAPASMT
ncbi:uncharacterized protein LOC122386078, partial [Amphibalanus amphitrite]|uniref:uncharacterized protein LOC122386078 n=1 Tax=Amphibalanus amphitrite TaxID=1232801 RepID=UPI001C8FD586